MNSNTLLEKTLKSACSGLVWGLCILLCQEGVGQNSIRIRKLHNDLIYGLYESTAESRISESLTGITAATDFRDFIYIVNDSLYFYTQYRREYCDEILPFFKNPSQKQYGYYLISKEVITFYDTLQQTIVYTGELDPTGMKLIAYLKDRKIKRDFVRCYAKQEDEGKKPYRPLRK